MFSRTKLRIVSHYLEKEHSQEFWDNMFRLSLNKMNYGPGGNLYDSGEINTIKYLKESFGCNENLVVFDVGANVGCYTNMVLDLLGNRAIVHAFEPSHQTFEMLQKNVTSNQVRLNNFGCSDKTHTMSLYSDKSDSGMNSVYNRRLDFLGISMKKTEQSKFVRIDEYCQENQIKHIHLLKLDIEGHELSALQGASDMISSNNIDCIQFEFGGCNIDSRTYFQDFYYLLHEKYDIYRILHNGLYKIDNYSTFLEVFVTVNYLAIHR